MSRLSPLCGQGVIGVRMPESIWRVMVPSARKDTSWGVLAVVVQSLSCVWPSVTYECSTPSFTVSCFLRPTESVMPSNHLILCCPLLLLPSVFPITRVFPNELVLPIRWPNYWSFSFSISPSNEYSGLISFRIDWFDLLAAQWTLKNLLWPHNSKASILWHSAFFMVQLSHPYMTTGKPQLWLHTLCQQRGVSVF